MKTIWKFNLPISNYCTIQIPKNYKILKVAEQKNEITLWAQVDDCKDTEDVTFRIVGTGQPLGDKQLKYLDSVSLYDGYLVFHVYKIFKCKVIK